jgi:hypothetical protein
MDIYKISTEVSNSIFVQWVPPSFELGGHNSEHDELELLVDDNNFGMCKTVPMFQATLELLENAAENGELIDLDEEHWRSLNNTESATLDFSEDEAMRYAKIYKRDINRIIEGIKSGAKIPAPVVVEFPDGQWYCAAGNTRLMVCRFMHITPKVWFINMNTDEIKEKLKEIYS